MAFANVRRPTAGEVLEPDLGCCIIYDVSKGQGNHVRAEVKGLSAGTSGAYVEVIEVIEAGPEAMVCIGDRFQASYDELSMEDR